MAQVTIPDNHDNQKAKVDIVTIPLQKGLQQGRENFIVDAFLVVKNHLYID